MSGDWFSFSLYDVTLFGFLGAAVLTFPVLLFITAPYGRHNRGGWGPTLPSTVGWVVMELPAVMTVALLFVLGDRATNTVAIVWLLLWELHYVHRALVYPFQRRGGERPMPIAIVGSAIFFNVVNAFLQGRWLFALSIPKTTAWLAEPRFLIGVTLFLGGLVINRQSDAILRGLRRPGETGYKVPRGGLYRWVSCPNYLGEIVEWMGWALLTWSLAGLAFAVWTFANLAPRAIAHHRWYRERFEDYPRDRKALIPFAF